MKMGKIEPVHAEKRPPDGAVAAGITPDGKQLFKLVTKRSRSVPKLGPDGQQMWELHPTTAKPVYPLRRHEVYDHEELFYLESDGHNNVYKQPYTPLTQEQIRAQERQKKAQSLMPKLAEALVAAQVDEVDLVSILQQRKAEMAYPQSMGKGQWRLSDGSIFEGTKTDAREAEADLQRQPEG